MKILSFDPSGNYGEKNWGTSGYCYGDSDFLPQRLKQVAASDYDSQQAYWFAHREIIEIVFPDICVIESYRLFGHKAKEQSGSSLETAQLIGYMHMVCHELNIPVFLQDPSTKQRHSDDILLRTGVIEKSGRRHTYKGELTTMHMRDALRHYMYFKKYNMKKVVK